MKKFKIILIATSIILLTGCTSPPPTQPSTFQPHITQHLARIEIPNLPPLSDINKSGQFVYFVIQSPADKVELKKRDLTNNKENLVRIFSYNHEIVKFAIAADEAHIAFMSKEKDKFIVYITDLSGERLIKVGEVPANNGDVKLDPEYFILKRVGLKHKFLFVPPSLGCGGSVLSYVSSNTVSACGKNTEIISDEQLLIIETKPGDNSMLATTDYENWEPKKILDLPVADIDIKNLELLDEKTLRITTAKEYLDVKFKD